MRLRGKMNSDIRYGMRLKITSLVLNTNKIVSECTIVNPTYPQQMAAPNIFVCEINVQLGIRRL